LGAFVVAANGGGESKPDYQSEDEKANIRGHETLVLWEATPFTRIVGKEGRELNKMPLYSVLRPWELGSGHDKRISTMNRVSCPSWETCRILEITLLGW
jgi:hypothetical protein